MKAEHRQIINQAHKLDIAPSELASELLERDLIESCISFLRKQKATFTSLSENMQEATIRELESVVRQAVKVAISIIAARGTVAIPVTLKSITVDKGLKVVADVDSQTPHRHELVDAAQNLCLLVLAPYDYSEGTDSILADKDQNDLPLDDVVDAELEESPELGALQQIADASVEGTGVTATVTKAERKPRAKKADKANDPLANFVEKIEGASISDELYTDAVLLVQREKKVSVPFLKAELAVSEEQAEAIIQRMEAEKVVSEENDMGGRAVYD